MCMHCTCDGVFQFARKSLDGPDLCMILSPRILGTFLSKIHTHKTGKKKQLIVQVSTTEQVYFKIYNMFK